MPKTCKALGCLYDVFSNGYCKRHQHLRTDAKAPKPLKSSNGNSIKRTPIKKKFKKITGEGELFMHLWCINAKYEKQSDGTTRLVRRCEVTNEELLEYSPMFFHHLLTKQAYPEYRLTQENIIMVSAQVHTNLHSIPLSKLIARYPNYIIVQKRIEIMKAYGKTVL